MVIDIAVNGFVVESRRSGLVLEFPTDLFGGESVPQSGQNSSQQGAFEFVGCAFLSRHSPLLGLLSLIGLVGLLFFVVGQFPAYG